MRRGRGDNRQTGTAPRKRGRWPEFVEALQDNELVLCTRLGTELDAGNVRRQFEVIAASAGLGTDCTPQELQHTFVSLLSAGGTPVEEIARLAGNSSTLAQLLFRRRRPQTVRNLSPPLVIGITVSTAVWGRLAS
jgi:hypothetical protein